MRVSSHPLTPQRRFIADLCHARQSVPLGIIRRNLALAPVHAARAAATHRVPWTVLFCKAYALVATDMPALRLAYVTLPWPRLVETPSSVASVMIERPWGHGTALLPARLKQPELRSLIDLAADLQRQRTLPLGDVRHFKVLDRLCHLPTPIRRLAWWLTFNIGSWRPAYWGTFGMSVLGQWGATIDVPVSPLSSFVSYGPFANDGSVEAIIAFDHRSMDGRTVAEALARLEAMLNGPIAQELRADGVSQDTDQIHHT